MASSARRQGCSPCRSNERTVNPEVAGSIPVEPAIKSTISVTVISDCHRNAFSAVTERSDRARSCMRRGPCRDPWAPVEPPSRGLHATDHLVERTGGPRQTPPNGIGHLWASSMAAAGVLKRLLSHGGLRLGGEATGWGRAVPPRPVPPPGGAGPFRRRGRRASRRSRGAPRSRDRRVPPAAP